MEGVLCPEARYGGGDIGGVSDTSLCVWWGRAGGGG